jgi:signal peptidase
MLLGTHRMLHVLMLTFMLSSNSSTLLLTKGDNNIADDTELYARDQDYLDRDKDIIGSVRGYIPGVGYVTILLSEHPWLKIVMLGLMGLMVVLQRE